MHSKCQTVSCAWSTWFLHAQHLWGPNADSPWQPVDTYIHLIQREGSKLRTGSACERLLGRRGGGIGRLIEGAEEEHVGGVVSEGDAVFFEGENDAAAELAEDGVALVGASAELDGIGDGAAFDLVYSQDVGVGDGYVLEGGIVAKIACDLGEDCDDFVGVGAGVDRDLEGGDGVVAGEVGDSGDLAVGDDVECAVGVADGGSAEGEVFDGALEAGEDDDLAYVVLIFYEDEEPGEHVFEEGLRAETDADA